MGNNNSTNNKNTDIDTESSNLHTINSDIFLSSLGHQSNYYNNSSINDKNINQKIIRLNNILGGNFNKINETSESILDQIFKETNNNKFDTITSINMNLSSELSNTSPFINNQIVRNMTQKGGRRSNSSSDISSSLSSNTSETLSNHSNSSLSSENTDNYLSSTAHTGGAATSESISYNSKLDSETETKLNNEYNFNNNNFIHPSDDESSISSPYNSDTELSNNNSDSELSGGYSEIDNNKSSEISYHYRLDYSDTETVDSDSINTENINLVTHN